MRPVDQTQGVDPSVRIRRVPQQLRSRERVEKILDAAARLVAVDGVENVGTRAIAEAAGVPVASIYQYFVDKEDILLAIVGRDIDAMDERMITDLGALETFSIATLVSTTMNAFVEVYRRRPAFVMIWLRGRTNAAIRQYGRQHNQRVARDLHSLASDLGLLTPDSPVRIADLAVEMGDRLFQLAFETHLQGDEETLVEARKIVTTYLELYATPAGREGVQV